MKHRIEIELECPVSDVMPIVNAWLAQTRNHGVSASFIGYHIVEPKDQVIFATGVSGTAIGES